MKKSRLKYIILGVPVMVLIFALNGEAAQKERVYVLVQEDIFPCLQNHLTVWKTVVEGEGRYTVTIVSGDWQDHDQVKDYLKEKYEQGWPPMAGAIFVGDIPAPLCSFSQGLSCWGCPPEYPPYPLESFYMKMNFYGFDKDGDGVFETVGPKSTVQMDIWIGRLTPNSGEGEDDITLLQQYFNKNIDYRTGKFDQLLHKEGLMIQNVEGSSDLTDISFDQQAGAVYQDMVVINKPYQMSAYKYLDMLEYGFETIFLNCHSSAESHVFNQDYPDIPDTEATSADIAETNPRAHFFWLHCCSAGDFTKEDYLAGSYIFGSDYGLIAASCVRPCLDNLEAPFCSIAETAGGDWGDILKDKYSQGDAFDLVFIGDPTLRIMPDPPDFMVWAPPVEITLGTEKTVEIFGQIITGTESSFLNIELQAEGWVEPVYYISVSGINDGLTMELEGVDNPESAFFNIYVSPWVPPGDYHLKLVGTRCGWEKECVLNVKVVKPDFSVSLAPSSATIPPGGDFDATLTAKLLKGINLVVHVFKKNLPEGMTVSPGGYVFPIASYGGMEEFKTLFHFTTDWDITPGIREAAFKAYADPAYIGYIEHECGMDVTILPAYTLSVASKNPAAQEMTILVQNQAINPEYYQVEFSCAARGGGVEAWFEPAVVELGPGKPSASTKMHYTFPGWPPKAYNSPAPPKSVKISGRMVDHYPKYPAQDVVTSLPSPTGMGGRGR
ncbi:MAG: hypothetical protein V1789_08545 [PVC group bacterium]